MRLEKNLCLEPAQEETRIHKDDQRSGLSDPPPQNIARLPPGGLRPPGAWHQRGPPPGQLTSKLNPSLRAMARRILEETVVANM